MLRAAIQGIHGSFHHAAALEYLGNQTQVVPCATFKELTKKVENGETEFGVMAVENTIAGSLLQNYQLIMKTPVHIVGEIYARIRQNLMALPGQTIHDIHTVRSHPVALEQCREYFDNKPGVRLVESEDTALSAKEIADEKVYGKAAIAPYTAAELYGLEIIAEAIETNSANYTRFWILSPDKNTDTSKINKASLSFTLKHKMGNLSQVLSVLSFYGINLTKIQSLPIIGREWEYRFFVDVVFEDYDRYSAAITAMKPLTEKTTILGEYTEGEKISSNAQKKASVSNLNNE